MSALSERYGHLEGWLKDVPGFLRAATERRRLEAGSNLLVATDLEQRVLTVRVLPRRRASYKGRSRLAYDVIAPVLERMVPPREPGMPPTGIGFIIRAREGRVVPVPEDAEWDQALNWAGGSICCFTGAVVLATPHGWRFADVAGRSPNLTELSRPKLRSIEGRD